MLLVAVGLWWSSKTVTLDAVGDVMLGRWVGRRIEREGVDSPYAKIRPIFVKADLVLGNLECALSSAPFAVQKQFLLRAKPEVARGLTSAHFTMLSLANNHAGDCGKQGIRDTRQALADAQVAPLGPEPQPAVWQGPGFRVGVLPLTDLPPAWLDRKGAWRETLSRLRKSVDVVIVTIHWGIEGQGRASDRQRALARQLAASGVDLVLGHHPHVLEPVEWLKGRKGRRCLVAYSLGNFIFDSPPGKGRTSTILSVQLDRYGVEGFSQTPITIRNGYPEPSAPTFTEPGKSLIQGKSSGKKG